MTDWPKIKISELIERGAILVHKDGNHGSNYPRVDEFGSVGLPFLTAKSLDNWEIDFDNAPRLSEKKASTFRFGFVAPGDVLLSHNATVGRVAIVPSNAETAVIGTSLTQFRVDTEQIVPDFLAFYFSSREFQNELSFVMSQTTRNQVPITQQRLLSIALPPPSIQKRIARTASVLTDKIELNRKTNKTLEAMAQAIFRDWFVDFGPVRRKMAGASEPSAILGGLLPPDAPNAAEVASLFPDRLADNGLPEGWEKGTLEDLTELAYGKSLPKKVRTAGKYPVYGSGGTDSTHNEYLVEGPGVIVGRKGTVGSLYWENSNFFPIDTVFYCSPKRHVPLLYIWYLLNTLPLATMNTDAAVPGLNRGNAYRLEVALPSKPSMAAFETLASTIRQSQTNNETQNVTLAETRDYLLPRLMNGSVKVGDVSHG